MTSLEEARQAANDANFTFGLLLGLTGGLLLLVLGLLATTLDPGEPSICCIETPTTVECIAFPGGKGCGSPPNGDYKINRYPGRFEGEGAARLRAILDDLKGTG